MATHYPPFSMAQAFGNVQNGQVDSHTPYGPVGAAPTATGEIGWNLRSFGRSAKGAGWSSAGEWEAASAVGGALILVVGVELTGGCSSEPFSISVRFSVDVEAEILLVGTDSQANPLVVAEASERKRIFTAGALGGETRTFAAEPHYVATSVALAQPYEAALLRCNVLQEMWIEDIGWPYLPTTKVSDIQARVSVIHSVIVPFV